jgi:hypothetical protein
MRWLRKKVKNWLYNDDDYGVGSKVVSVHESSNSVDSEPVLNFRIYAANNGRILEFNKYDRLKDRTDRSLYIIDKEQDIGEYVGKVLSLELLK